MGSQWEGHDDEPTGDDEETLAGVAAGAVTFLTLAVAFGLMFLGTPWFWVVFAVGFGGLLPLSVSVAKWYESTHTAGRERERASGPTGSSGRSDDADEALEALRERYARGEIDDEEFEARVERLLETESVDDAEEFLGSPGEGRDRGERGRERDEVERA